MKSQRLSKKFRPPTPPYYNIRQAPLLPNSTCSLKNNRMKLSSTQRLPSISFYSTTNSSITNIQDVPTEQNYPSTYTKKFSW